MEVAGGRPRGGSCLGADPSLPSAGLRGGSGGGGGCSIPPPPPPGAAAGPGETERRGRRGEEAALPQPGRARTSSVARPARTPARAQGGPQKPGARPAAEVTWGRQRRGPERAGAAGADGDRALRTEGGAARAHRGVPTGRGGDARALPCSEGGGGAGEGARGGAAKRGPPPAPAILFLSGPSSRAAKPRPPRALLLVRLEKSSASGRPLWAPGFPLDRQVGQPMRARLPAPAHSFGGASFFCEGRARRQSVVRSPSGLWGRRFSPSSFGGRGGEDCSGRGAPFTGQEPGLGVLPGLLSLPCGVQGGLGPVVENSPFGGEGEVGELGFRGRSGRLWRGCWGYEGVCVR